MITPIFIMWKRQLKKYWRSKARMLASLGQPLLFLFALGLGLNPVFEQAGQGNYLFFLIPGIAAMSIMFNAMFSGIEVIWERQFGFLKETLVAPVPRWTIMLGKTLGGATVATMQGVIVLAIGILVGFRPISVFGLLVGLLVMFVVALIFSGFGVAIASRMQDMQAFPLLMNFVMMPLFFLSGALYPLTNLQPVLQAITVLNPLTYGVDALRSALTGVTHIGFFVNSIVLCTVCVAVISIGSMLFEKIQV